jgi:hypothetical protein
VAKGQNGDAGAVFDLAPKLGSVSDKRAANGGVMACEKKAKKHNLNETGQAGHSVALSRSGTAGRLHAGLTGGHEA